MLKKIRYKILTILFSLLFFFDGLVFFAQEQKTSKIETSIINIESAHKSEYKKDPVNDGDCILLNGEVKISVTKGSNKTTIYADFVNYNRSTEMLYAEGNVILEQTSGGSQGGESITANSLLFNTSTLEGVFDNGRAVQTSSDAINLPSGSTLIVASNIFGRDSSGTIAFKSGELTFCDDENPHWKIKASRIWLLPGGEFAFFNALLYVGRVPLMYFPAFYYPKDELIFNPAIGYKFREGYFINTTTYLYGRKPIDAASTSDNSEADNDDKIDFFSFMKPTTLKEQVREGLILHNLDEDYNGDTTNHVKIMADYYSNLGAMIGGDVVIKPKNIFSLLEANLELGFSNTLFKRNGEYLPFNSKGKKVSDSSNFMTLDLPFRYQANLKFAISKPLNLTIDIPIYSDPYFDYDFNSRAETMDWIDFLMSGTEKDDDEDDISTITSFSWKLNGSYTFKIPEFLNPFITSLSISNFSSSIDFSSKSNDTLSERDEFKDDSSWRQYTPERHFYYPNQITPIKISGRIAGTLFQYPSIEKKSSVQVSKINLIPPKSIDSLEDSTKNVEEVINSETDLEPIENPETDVDNFALPESALPLLSGGMNSVKNLTTVSYKLGYSIAPDFLTQFSYSSSNIKSPEDFVWSDFQSTYIQTKAPSTLTSTLKIKDNFLSLTDTFNFNPVYQRHPYLKKDTNDGGYSESSVASIKKADYNARKLDLTNVNSLSIKPFYYTDYFSGTALTWNTTLKMIRTKYISEDVENPEWEYLTTDIWDDESFTVHNLNFVFAAKEGDFSQELSLTTTLPPQIDEYRGVLTLKFPFTTFSVGTGIKQKSKDDKDWEKQDLSQSFSINLFENKLKLTQSFVFDLEEWYKDSFRLSVSGYGMQFAYTMSYVLGYDFNSDTGWKIKTEKEFQPYTASFAYTSGSKNFKYWSEKISFTPTLSTSIVYDCLRPTNSYFKFIPGITFKVNNFIDISFSSESRNDVIYRYFQDVFGGSAKLAGETNPVKDLFNSFKFDDETARRNSGFKLKSLNVKITHDLDDWDLNCEFSIKPRLITDTAQKYYDFSPYFSISVSWRPMASMKTEIVDEYGEWQLNP